MPHLNNSLKTIHPETKKYALTSSVKAYFHIPEAVQNRPYSRPTEEARADSTVEYGKRAPAGRTTKMGGYQRPRVAITSDTVPPDLS